MSSTYSNSSETIGAQQLVTAFGSVFPKLRVLRNVIIPLPADSALATAEIDTIVVCPAGIFIFEIKAWHDAYVFREKVPDAPTRWFLRPQGSNELQQLRDPSAQGAFKMATLRSIMPKQIRLQYFVFLPCNGVEIEPSMPPGVITAADLPYLVRTIRKSSQSPKSPCATLDDEAIDIAAEMLLSMRGDLTEAQHISNCQEYARSKLGVDSRFAGCDSVAEEADHHMHNATFNSSAFDACSAP
ncbi:MAG: NERD domain-containing protein [Burkholderiaceae bacterium]|nr:MAG: NERD domain-containing protein [Burkholderiaceae bacterium]TBR76163.1 MAG: NERD domain-containing protein [Burkholderiaceae bacterium]